MSLSRPLWRCGQAVSSSFRSQPSYLPYTSNRTIFNFFKRNKRAGDTKSKVEPPPELVTADFLKARRKAQAAEQPLPKQGDLASSSIFADEDTPPEGEGEKPPGETFRDPVTMAPVLDPIPEVRERWQRRMVIHSIRNRGRLNKKEILMRTERELLHKSQWIPTSIKKLGPLARQIAGKTVDDAILQMRYSKKRAARAVLSHLKEAKDLATVSRGMGLGKHDPETGEQPPITIELKDGRKKKVNNPTEMYIDQAWIGRGSWQKSADVKARGRVGIIQHPHTSLTVILKEEKTRIRQHEERERKRKNRKLWVQLPDRPITAQRQYYSW
ncbi:MAG: 54S ribosomal protein L22, mitochondrial [Cirrosporium novae-zelandiae]|nr:MAG: 54S ribosomal protein L22, mitochondrial [Cirrosporium novae-zelandiae]